MKIGIVGSRRRNFSEDLIILERTFVKILAVELGVYFGDIDDLGSSLKDVTIVTGDCCDGGDKFAKHLANIYGCKLDVKHKIDPETGEKLVRYIDDYFEFCNICYARNEGIAKEPLDYLIALVHHSRTGGTENTIKHFKRYHKDWEGKLIILE